MKKINVLLVSLLVCIACVDIVWLLFPDYLNRKYSIVLTIPVIMICYFLYTELKSILYLLALCTFMIADYFFFIEKNLANGIISSAIALVLYGVIVLKQSHYISTIRLLIGTIPFIVIYMLPFFFIVENISDEIFGVVVFYSFAIGFFSLMSIITYLSSKNRITKKLLIAGIATAFMGILFVIYLFLEQKRVYTVIANFLFMYSHYKMWQYITTKDFTANQLYYN